MGEATPQRKGPTGHLQRVPPHDLVTEQNLIGAALMSVDAAALVASIDPAAFYNNGNGTIAAVIAALVAKASPVDAGTVAAELRVQGQLDAVGNDGRAGGGYLVYCMSQVPAIGSAASYAAYVLDHAHRREMLRLAGEVVEATYSGVSADGLVAQMAQAAAEAAEGTATSWEPVNLAMTLAGEGTAAEPAYLRRSDGTCLLYPEKVHAFNAEPETGKSWLALAACAERMAEGGHVAYIDFEAGPVDITERLLSLGVDPAQLLERFHYVRPDDGIDATARVRMLELCATYGVTLAVIDGLAEAAVLSGWNENYAEVMQIFSLLARPIASSGAAVVVIDHLQKDKEKQGAYARGFGGKLAGIDGSVYKLETIKPFGRGLHGIARVVVKKDRHGFIRAAALGGHIIGEMHVESPGDGGRVRVSVTPPTGADITASGRTRRTGYMERVSMAVEQSRVPVSRTWVQANIEGAKTAPYVRDAIDTLVEDGYFEETPHGQARYCRSVRPFRESGDPVYDDQEGIEDDEMF